MKYSSYVVVSALASAVLAEEPSTVTVYFSGSTDTHVYGSFDRTSAAETSSETGTDTRVYGKFDKPSAAGTSSETGTWGRFDKTKEPVTTTIFLSATSADNNGANSSVSSSFEAGAASLSGLSVGLAGAFAVGLFLL